MVFQKQKGMSLVEVLVAIGIFTMGIAGLSALVGSVWKSKSFIMETGEASMKASRGVEQTVKEIRKTRQADTGAYPVKSGDDFDLVVYLDIDNDSVTERVHYFLDQADDQFKKGITKPAGSPLSYPAGDAEVKVISDYVVNENNQPVFYYFNSDYPADLVNNPIAVPISVENVRLIKIHLLVNIKPLSAPDNINIESFVELRNINDYDAI